MAGQIWPNDNFYWLRQSDVGYQPKDDADPLVALTQTQSTLESVAPSGGENLYYDAFQSSSTPTPSTETLNEFRSLCLAPVYEVRPVSSDWLREFAVEYYLRDLRRIPGNSLQIRAERPRGFSEITSSALLFPGPSMDGLWNIQWILHDDALSM